MGGESKAARPAPDGLFAGALFALAEEGREEAALFALAGEAAEAALSALFLGLRESFLRLLRGSAGRFAGGGGREGGAEAAREPFLRTRERAGAAAAERERFGMILPIEQSSGGNCQELIC